VEVEKSELSGLRKPGINYQTCVGGKIPDHPSMRLRGRNSSGAVSGVVVVERNAWILQTMPNQPE
jgi:hypothetical protein